MANTYTTWETEAETKAWFAKKEKDRDQAMMADLSSSE